MELFSATKNSDRDGVWLSWFLVRSSCENLLSNVCSYSDLRLKFNILIFYWRIIVRLILFIKRSISKERFFTWSIYKNCFLIYELRKSVKHVIQSIFVWLFWILVCLNFSTRLMTFIYIYIIVVTNTWRGISSGCSFVWRRTSGIRTIFAFQSWVLSFEFLDQWLLEPIH